MGTASELYKRFAKRGVPGFQLDEFDGAPMPEEFEHLLDWHFDMRKRRAGGLAGVDPLSLMDIDYYRATLGRLGIEMEPFDEHLLGAIDDIYLDVQNNRIPEPTRPGSKSPPKHH